MDNIRIIIDRIKGLGTAIVKIVTNMPDTIKNFYENNPGLSIVIAAVIISLILEDKFTFFLFAIAVYIIYIKKKEYEFDRKKKLMDSIDIKLLSNQENISLSAIMDDYVSDCFNRDVIFFRGLKQKEYINDADEKEMLNTLLESVASNLSPEMRSKLELYYGEGRVDIILARKAFITVSLFVANNNKAIFVPDATTTK